MLHVMCCLTLTISSQFHVPEIRVFVALLWSQENEYAPECSTSESASLGISRDHSSDGFILLGWKRHANPIATMLSCHGSDVREWEKTKWQIFPVCVTYLPRGKLETFSHLNLWMFSETQCSVTCEMPLSAPQDTHAPTSPGALLWRLMHFSVSSISSKVTLHFLAIFSLNCPSFNVCIQGFMVYVSAQNYHKLSLV